MNSSRLLLYAGIITEGLLDYTDQVNHVFPNSIIGSQYTPSLTVDLLSYHHSNLNLEIDYLIDQYHWRAGYVR